MSNQNSSLFSKPMTTAQAKAKEEMLSMAKKYCNESGGYGLVSDRYAFIDLRVYDAKLKEDNNVEDIQTAKSSK